MKNELIQAYNEFQQIYVRGIDCKHMFMGLSLLEQILNQLPDEKEPEETKPKKK